ncbi:hypothetical protein [Streptomyces sp. LN245]|uniref:hypothetical protein n=1 Tax=Streptomyces sp. LN245 TaxID=3112975 RepID=UPI00371F799B
MSALLGYTSERRRLRRAEALTVSEGTGSKHSGSVLTQLDLPLSDSTNRRVLPVPAYLRGWSTRRRPTGRPPRTKLIRRGTRTGWPAPSAGSDRAPEPVHQLCGDPPASASGDEDDATAFLQQVHELGMQAFGFDAAQPRDVVALNGAVRGPAEAGAGPRHGVRKRLVGHVPLDDQVIFRHLRRPGPGDPARNESH